MSELKLGALEKLITLGYVTGNYVHKSEDGEYHFELKTLSPLVEQEAFDTVEQSGAKTEGAKNILASIELLARSVTKVNNVPLEEAPGAEGSTPLEKKKAIIKLFGQQLLLGLWGRYVELKGSTELTSQGAEEIKK